MKIDLEAKREEVFDSITDEQIVDAYYELPDDYQLTNEQMVEAMTMFLGAKFVHHLREIVTDEIMERTDWEAQARDEEMDMRCDMAEMEERKCE